MARFVYASASTLWSGLDETVQAQRVVAEFVREATARGLRTENLVVRPYSGRGTYRSRLRGWYVRRDHSLAIGSGGEFYVLSVPTSLRARFAGAHLAASDPPLVAGRGGRDGHAMALDALLRQRLDAGNSFG